MGELATAVLGEIGGSRLSFGGRLVGRCSRDRGLQPGVEGNWGSGNNCWRKGLEVEGKFWEVEEGLENLVYWFFLVFYWFSEALGWTGVGWLLQMTFFTG